MRWIQALMVHPSPVVTLSKDNLHYDVNQLAIHFPKEQWEGVEYKELGLHQVVQHSGHMGDIPGYRNPQLVLDI